MDARFDRAYSRYGMTVANERAYHACISGPVVESSR